MKHRIRLNLVISCSQWLINVAGQTTSVVGIVERFIESNTSSCLIEFIRSWRKAIVVTVLPSLEKHKNNSYDWSSNEDVHPISSARIPKRKPNYRSRNRRLPNLRRADSSHAIASKQEHAVGIRARSHCAGSRVEVLPLLLVDTSPCWTPIASMLSRFPAYVCQCWRDSAPIGYVSACWSALTVP